MDLLGLIFELIELRSFSNLWYWIVLAVMWSTATHWVMGVPWDMAQRARKMPGTQVQKDFDTLAQLHSRRILLVIRLTGLWIIGFFAFMLTGLLILGFGYSNEFAQAVFLLIFPLSIVGMLSIWTAHKIERQDLSGLALYNTLRLQRFLTYLIATIAIFVTALWGMYKNLTIGHFGG